MAKKKTSPIDVYKLLPKTNCKECGEENCMAFATKLVNREATLEQCTPLLQDRYKGAYAKLWEMLKPPVREVKVGTGDRQVRLGGKLVMYRHEFTYVNPTAIAIDITDEMGDDEAIERVKWTENFSYNYIGQNLKLDLLAIRSTGNQPERFAQTVKKVSENTTLPLILCSTDPEAVKSGLAQVADSRPLIYTATRDNWRQMANLALSNKCPLSVSAPNDPKTLRSLAMTLVDYGVEELVLDPGTFMDPGLVDTINNFTMLRRLSCKEEDEYLGFPLMGTPMTVWGNRSELPEITAWKEAYLTALLINRYADLVVVHSTDGWILLPNVILRQNIYTDPRKPVAVEAGMKMFGQPDEKSPMMFTSNFALTYYTVASDIESAGVSCYVIIVDTEGLSVESAVAGRKLTAEKVAESLKVNDAERKVSHKTLIIPGRAARLSGELEEVSGWKVLVGPMDSSGIPKFIQQKWQQATG